MNTIVDIWKELDAQLEEKFPKLYATLNPGASELEIKNLESHFSAPIPDDLKASLRVHNGQNDPNLTNGIFNFQVLLSCDRILEEFNISMPKHQYIEETRQRDIRFSARSIENLTHEESLLYNLVSKEYISLDEIVEKLNFSVASISGILLRLQMKKLIREVPGKQFIKITDEQ